MRLHVSFLLAIFALHARAASIQGPAVLELEKKLPAPEPNKDAIPSENASSEQELIDSANTVKDIENNLRVKAIDNIPVSVIVESDVNPTSDNEVTPDIKRAPIDLKNPGEPQRQEHETQNAVHYDEEQQIVTTVKQTVVDTQNALRQGFQGVTQGIQDWIANNEQLSAIQASIHNLQESFQNQINKLNDTLQTFWQNRVGTSPQQAVAGGVDPKPEIATVETHLKTLEDNFQLGVKALSEGVEVFATLKAENENPSAPTPSAPNNLFLQYLQLFQNTISQGFNNVTHAFQNYVSSSQSATGTSSPGLLQGLNNGIQNIFNQGSAPPADAQSDEAPQRPTLWQGLQSSIQNILKPTGQAAQGSNGGTPPNRPITQAIQNLPFVQGVVSLIQPNKPAQPSKPSDPAQPAAEGSNVVPAETKPESDQQPAKSPTVEEVKPDAGPIQNIIQNNAIVKGISGAVQKLQASISNPEKPRDTEKETDNEKGDTKGGFHGGYNNYNSDNNNDEHGSGVVKSDALPASNEEVKEETVPEKPTAVAEETRVDTDKTDKS